MSYTYCIEIRHRIKGARGCMEWQRVPGTYRSRRALDSRAAEMVRSSHSLDIRGVRRDGNLTHTINYRIG